MLNNSSSCHVQISLINDKNNDKILMFVFNYLEIFKYYKLMDLFARRIYIRFIRQQERHSFSVSIVGSCIRWGKTVLHTKITRTA
jgi:hypothetical protein